MDFNNTAIAFRSKSKSQLLRSYWLFRLMDYPILVWIGTRLLELCLRWRLPIEMIVRATLFRQFCGGETIDECRGTIAELARFHIGTILDYSVEGAGSERAFESTCAEIRRTIDLAKGNPDVPFCVFKVSGIGRPALLEKRASGQPIREAEFDEWRRVHERVESLCGQAFENGVRVFIDAEESWIQDTIDELSFEMMEKYNRETAIVFNTLQMYRTDRMDFLRRSYERAEAKGFRLGVKIVRGAYLEKERDRARRLGRPSPLSSEKADADRSFNEALEFCLARLKRICLCAGTHNEASTQWLLELMERHGVAKEDPGVFFAQLFGMSDHLSYNLANGGYHVAKYVPYGPVRAVLPYLFRRAEENTSIRGQSSRELSLLVRERERRAKTR